MSINKGDFKSGKVTVDRASDMTPCEAMKVIGQTVVGVDASENGLLLVFAGGANLYITGHRWDDCSMGVEFSDE